MKVDHLIKCQNPSYSLFDLHYMKNRSGKTKILRDTSSVQLNVCGVFHVLY